jgi:ubiquitin carboxyl-terminal hydrolase 10
MKPEAVHTIIDALQQLSQPQTVQVTSPTRAGQTVDAQQTVLIDSLPSILVLHLKRFMYDTNVKDVVKIGKKVAFERELEIAPGG